MLYHKNWSRLIFYLFCLIALNDLASVSYAKDDAVDLGENGFTSSVQSKEIAEDYITKSISGNIMKNITLKPIKLSCRSALPKHQGPIIVKHIRFKKNSSLMIGTKIFVFSCNDEESLKAATQVSFDYGLCIEYKSIDDIRDFKESLKLKKPIAISNDDMAKAFGVSAYPALITVHDDEFEIQEGF